MAGPATGPAIVGEGPVLAPLDAEAVGPVGPVEPVEPILGGKTCKPPKRRSKQSRRAALPVIFVSGRSIMSGIMRHATTPLLKCVVPLLGLIVSYNTFGRLCRTTPWICVVQPLGLI